MSDMESEDFSDEDRIEETEEALGFTNEDNVNKRAGHVAVAHNGRVIVWGGYMENQSNDGGDYWPTSEVWIYSSLVGEWIRRRTIGPAPTKCSGAAATVMDDQMYVVAGFHKIFVNKKMYMEAEYEPSDDPESGPEEEDLVQAIQVDRLLAKISNDLWRLDLTSWTWTKLEPDGRRPLRCDKTACWSYNNRIYLFGGFGPPPALAGKTFSEPPDCDFEEDPSTSGMYPRGWSNQLVCYNTVTNVWEWPVTTGPTPKPRAAHTVSVIGDVAYVFGGRHQDVRMNDLHRLDLVTMSWSCVLPATDYPPLGRSWQVLVPLETGRREGGLLMYGGFGNEEVTLSDCWVIDLHSNPLSWVRCKHWEDGPRLWHAAASADPGQILVVGGLTNNILAPSYILKHHAEKVIHISTAPKSLLKITLDFVTKNRAILSSQFQDLPLRLRTIVEHRCKEKSGGG